MEEVWIGYSQDTPIEEVRKLAAEKLNTTEEKIEIKIEGGGILAREQVDDDETPPTRSQEPNTILAERRKECK